MPFERPLHLGHHRGYLAQSLRAGLRRMIGRSPPRSGCSSLRSFSMRCFSGDAAGVLQPKAWTPRALPAGHRLARAGDRSFCCWPNSPARRRARPMCRRISRTASLCRDDAGDELRSSARRLAQRRRGRAPARGARPRRRGGARGRRRGAQCAAAASRRRDRRGDDRGAGGGRAPRRGGRLEGGADRHRARHRHRRHRVTSRSRSRRCARMSRRSAARRAWCSAAIGSADAERRDFTINALSVAAGRHGARLCRRPRRHRRAPRALHRRSAAADRRGLFAHPAVLSLSRVFRRGPARCGGLARLHQRARGLRDTVARTRAHGAAEALRRAARGADARGHGGERASRHGARRRRLPRELREHGQGRSGARRSKPTRCAGSARSA